ncbi:MAG: RNA-binding protein [Bacteriovoracaceae bacterium]|nr:RNA-binding protein [Bacteriovoracaceae bacterium]
MEKKLYVGNLPFSVNDASLSEQFAAFGEVASAKVIIDRETNRSKGFGFVEMTTAESAQAAIEGLNGADFGGRQMKVTEAKPQKPRDSRW